MAFSQALAQALAARRTRLLNRIHARRAARSGLVSGFTVIPEPHAVGSYVTGQRLIAGEVMLGGGRVTAPGAVLWDIAPPTPGFAADAQGFGWLDDLAAVGDLAARRLAQDWTQAWLVRFGFGRGPGWAPDVVGRRLAAWIGHAQFLLHGQDLAATEAFFAGLTAQALFLSRRWQTAPPGIARIGALGGLLRAALSLDAIEPHAGPAAAALGRECAALIDPGGALTSRNPEELLEVFALLIRAAAVLGEAGRRAAPEHSAAIERIAPTLRGLRHADGGLARFNGGGRGGEGRLDQALAQSGLRGAARPGLAMGFARLSAGRTTVILDGAAPPTGAASATAHAGTLAFELTSARRPVVVNCGSGAAFGAAWRQAGRATAAHSTVSIEGMNSARFGPGRAGGAAPLLTQVPRKVTLRQGSGPAGQSLFASHDGYVAARGLTHVRQLDLSFDGRELRGDDTLGPTSGQHRRLGRGGVRFALRFHLHPEVEAAPDPRGAAVMLALKSGEVWVFRHDGVAALALEPSVWLEPGQAAPVATRQIVLTARVIDRPCQLRWTLAKAQDTPRAVRDLYPSG